MKTEKRNRKKGEENRKTGGREQENRGKRIGKQGEENRKTGRRKQENMSKEKRKTAGGELAKKRKKI